MKFDPIDGKERDESLECYRKDRVYGWIQGRGLESLTGHLEWVDGLPGYEILGREALRERAESLYRRLLGACFGPAGLQVGFVMDLEGRSLGPADESGSTTLTHLFVLRGLLAYAAYRRYEADMGMILPALRRAVDASIEGGCLDDQIAFGDRGGEGRLADRIGFEGQMISIGACELLFRYSRSSEDLERGFAAIDSILSRFSIRDSSGELALFDGLDAHGLPYREGGRLPSNPGHAIEVAGLGLQFIRRATEIVGEEVLGTREATIEGLRELGLHLGRAGRAPHGGVVRSIDAETSELLGGNCPWWSSYEAVRTFAEIYRFARSDEERETCLDYVESFIDCIERVYLAPSSIGVPVQTVDYSGAVIPFIPATPDIDPCYHTGLPILEAYEVLGGEASLLGGFSERPVAARLGVRLQGHITREEPAEREMDGLHARCCWLASPAEQVSLISVDALELSGDWAERVAGRISAEFGIPERNVVLLATHTHTAPAAIDLGLLKRDEAFLGLIEDAVLSAAREAAEELSPVAASWRSTTVQGLGVNRRYRDPVSGKVSMRPNPSGEIDEELSGLFFFDEGGRLRGLLANMAIHPTTLGTDIHDVSADYPGRLVAGLRARLSDSIVVLPLQGACGDVRPRVVDAEGKEFREGTEADIVRIGEALADGLARCLDSIDGKDWIDGRGLRFLSRDIELRFARPPLYEEIRSVESDMRALLETKGEPAKGKDFASAKVKDFASAKVKDFASRHDSLLQSAPSFLAWAAGLEASAFDAQHRYVGPGGALARLAYCALGPSVSLFFIPGEAFCHIGIELKRRASPAKAMICGYYGGSVGYIPTARAAAEGGYEVESAFRFYGFPAPFSSGAEESIYEAFASMMS